MAESPYANYDYTALCDFNRIIDIVVFLSLVIDLWFY